MDEPNPLHRPPPPPVRGRVGVVGVCASGKTTLVEALVRLGYDARQCGQEHSYIPDMWQRLTCPQVLIYLDTSPNVARERRNMHLRGTDHAAQRERLAHARAHCDLCIDTDPFTPEQVLEVALAALQRLLPGRPGNRPSEPAA